MSTIEQIFETEFYMRKNKYSKILIHTSTNTDLEIWPFIMFICLQSCIITWSNKRNKRQTPEIYLYIKANEQIQQPQNFYGQN